jgi:hypothetical protein
LALSRFGFLILLHAFEAQRVFRRGPQVTAHSQENGRCHSHDDSRANQQKDVQDLNGQHNA